MNGTYGYIDKTGKEVVIPPEYYIKANFSEGLAVVYFDGNGKYGYIDKTGKEVIPPKYGLAGDFSEGLAMVYLNGKDGYKYGYIDKTGKVVIPPKYDSADRFSEGLAKVSLNGKDGYKCGYIDKTGNEVTPLKYYSARRFSEGLASVNLNGKLRYIDKTGKEVIPPKYHSAGDFSEGLAAVSLYGQCGYIGLADGAPEPAPAPAPAGIKALPTASKVLVNAKDTAFDAYNIEGNNYFKLRDIAFALTETDKKFEVSWDEKAQAISITTNKAYTKVGGEMAAPATTEKVATVSNAKIMIDGKEVQLKAYNINGNNYFKLRDLGKNLKFQVGWDEAKNSVSVDTSKDYSEK